MPVIQPRPLDRLVADVKAKGLDEVEPAPGGRAGPGDVSGIHMDLRLDQHDIEHEITSFAGFPIRLSEHIVPHLPLNFNNRTHEKNISFCTFVPKRTKKPPLESLTSAYVSFVLYLL